MMQGSSQLHLCLKNMEESLSCVVCRDIFRNPISLYPCQHSFCSECVRKSLKEQLKSLKRTANCPVCRIQLDATGIAFDKCIRPNPTLEDLSKAYSKIRNELYSVLVPFEKRKSQRRQRNRPINNEVKNGLLRLMARKLIIV